mgnify:CR=1 FL=1
MANIFSKLNDWWSGKTMLDGNLLNRTLYQMIGGQAAHYDADAKTYLEQGFGNNPDVFAIIMQQADKTKAVPYAVKKIEDKANFRKLQELRTATKGDFTIQQMARAKVLESKAFASNEVKFPLEQPNPNQTWGEIFALYKIFLKVTGNVYFYTVSPKEGANVGVPKQLYLLPSHLVKIVLKSDANVLEDENPIDYYMLIEGDQYIKFQTEDVFHVKTPNPFYDFSGSHLYGLSPIKAGLRNLQSSNSALDHNVKTMENSGIYGFLTSADADKPFTAEQALQMKDKLREMDNASGRLSRIAGSSVPIAFTKLSLNTDELKQFDFLKYDQKTLCNILEWSDKLLNSDTALTYDNLKQERKRVITDNIQPDLVLLAEAFNKHFIQKFKGYENCLIEWDITELPEMQEDYKMMVEWMKQAPLTPNEIRTALKYETMDIEGMDVPWIEQGRKRIDEVSVTETDITKSYEML